MNHNSNIAANTRQNRSRLTRILDQFQKASCQLNYNEGRELHKPIPYRYRPDRQTPMRCDYRPWPMNTDLPRLQLGVIGSGMGPGIRADPTPPPSRYYK